jgi:transcriptional regulator with XRE-family HTH domain
VEALRSLDDIRRLVKAQRKRQNLSQARAAGLIGHTQKWLSDFENGRTDPPTSMTLKLLVLLGIPLTAGPVSVPDGLEPSGEHVIDIDEGL